MISLTKISAGQQKSVIGYGFYQDDSTSNLVVGTSPVQFNVNGLGSNTFKDELPYDVTDLWDTSTNKIIPSGLNDAYNSRIGFEVLSVTGVPKILNIVVDIGTAPGGDIPIHETTLQLDKTEPYTKGYSVPLFSRETFMSNKARILLYTDTGSVTLTSRNIFLLRLYKSF